MRVKKATVDAKDNFTVFVECAVSKREAIEDRLQSRIKRNAPQIRNMNLNVHLYKTSVFIHTSFNAKENKKIMKRG